MENSIGGRTSTKFPSFVHFLIFWSWWSQIIKIITNYQNLASGGQVAIFAKLFLIVKFFTDHKNPLNHSRWTKSNSDLGRWTSGSICKCVAETLTEKRVLQQKFKHLEVRMYIFNLHLHCHCHHPEVDNDELITKILWFYCWPNWHDGNDNGGLQMIILIIIFILPIIMMMMMTMVRWQCRWMIVKQEVCQRSRSYMSFLIGITIMWWWWWWYCDNDDERWWGWRIMGMLRMMRMKDGNTHLKISSMFSLKAFTFHHVFFFEKNIKRQRLNIKV